MAYTLRSELPTITITRLDVNPNHTVNVSDLLRGLKKPALKNLSVDADCDTVSHVHSLGDSTVRVTKPTPDQTIPANDFKNGLAQQMQAPKLTRMYTKETEHSTPRIEVSRGASSLFGSQGLIVVDELENQVKRRARKPPKKKRKKRRAPVHELALVPSLPVDLGSPKVIKSKLRSTSNSRATSGKQLSEALSGIDLGQLEEIDPLIDDSPLVHKKSKLPKNPNVGKQMTRNREAFGLPKCSNISHEGFRFPPATPKPKRPPGWKLGSGFEGVKLGSMLGPKLTKTVKPSSRTANNIRHLRYFQQELELSTTLSPCRQKRKSQLSMTAKDLAKSPVPAKGHRHPEDPHTAANASAVGATDRTRDDKVYDSAILPRQQAKLQRLGGSKHRRETNLRTVRLETDDISDDSACHSQSNQTVREPSKSERNGWLKRRRKVSLAFEVGTAMQPVRFEPHQEAIDDSAGQVINRHYQTRSTQHMNNTEKAHKAQRVIADPQSQLLKLPIQNPTQSEFNNVDEEILDEPSPSKRNRPSRALQEPTKAPRDSSSISTHLPAHLHIPSEHVHVPQPSSSQEAQDSFKLGAHASSISRREAATHPEDHTSSRGTDPGNPSPSDHAHRPSHQISHASLSASKYFSNAIEQLNSPEKAPVPNTRSKSTHRPGGFSTPHQDRDEGLANIFHTQQRFPHINVLPANNKLKRSRTEYGYLELGVTPRLKKSMSKVFFRPPFKAMAS